MSWATAAAIGIPIIANTIAQDQARRAQDDTNKANREINERNINLQREFAQQGIRWKVEDAKAAGINPLAALGAATTSFSPSLIGQESDQSHNYTAQMGQDISRSIQATRTEDERQMADLQIANAKLDLEGKALDNQIRASQLQKQNQVGPGLPSAIDDNNIPGQNVGYRVKAAEPTASQKGNPAGEAGAINSYGYARTNDGYTIVPSKDTKERIEDDFIGETLWHMKNRVNPKPPSPREYPIPKHLQQKGYKYWFWNPFTQEFQPSKNP